MTAALNEEMKGRIFSSSPIVSPPCQCDRILVFDRGRIVESGALDELERKGGGRRAGKGPIHFRCPAKIAAHQRLVERPCLLRVIIWVIKCPLLGVKADI